MVASFEAAGPVDAIYFQGATLAEYLARYQELHSSPREGRGGVRGEILAHKPSTFAIRA